MLFEYKRIHHFIEKIKLNYNISSELENNLINLYKANESILDNSLTQPFPPWNFILKKFLIVLKEPEIAETVDSGRISEERVHLYEQWWQNVIADPQFQLSL